MAHSLVSLLIMKQAADTSPPWWYLTRTSAVAAYVTLTGSVALGLLQSIARQGKQRLPWFVDDLHQFVATLSGVLVLAHLYTLYQDTFIGFSLGNLLFPGAQPYRPLATNLGVLAMYGMVALLCSSWLRRRIPYNVWRAIHYVSFLTFIIVTFHGFLAGSDADEPWMRAIYGAAAAAIAFLTLMRVVARPPATLPQM